MAIASLSGIQRQAPGRGCCQGFFRSFKSETVMMGTITTA